MSSQPKNFITEAEYLDLERHAEFKSEYYQGEMFAMSGGTLRHGLILSNLVGELRQQLKAKPCWVCSSDVRLRVTSTGLYTYPDVMVVCGQVQFADNRSDTVLNPAVLIEVLSDSTRDDDLGRKCQHYRALPSLTAYLTVEQNSIRAVRHVRQPDGQWLLAEFDQLDQTVELSSIGCTLPMAEIYDKVDFSAE